MTKLSTLAFTRDALTNAAEHLARNGQPIDGAIILGLISALDGHVRLDADEQQPLIDQDDWFAAVHDCINWATLGTQANGVYNVADGTSGRVITVDDSVV